LFLIYSKTYAISIQMTRSTNTTVAPAPGRLRHSSQTVSAGGETTGRIDAAAATGGGVRECQTKRHDGWTPDRQRIFLNTLAETGIVEDACGAAGMSRLSACAFRNRAAEGLSALAGTRPASSRAAGWPTR
jgi:hypothetical protein